MNNILSKLLGGQTIRLFAAIIGVIVIFSGILTMTAKEERVVLDRPANETLSGNLVSVERRVAGRDLYYYIVTVAFETGQRRFVIEPGYSHVFDYDAFTALVPVDSVIEVMAETTPCVEGSDLNPILSVSSAGEEYLSYDDVARAIGRVELTRAGGAGWLFVIVGAALTVPLIFSLVTGSGSTSGRVIRTRRSSMPINSKYLKK